MYEKRIPLSKLRVKSFITSVNVTQVRGGGTTNDVVKTGIIISEIDPGDTSSLSIYVTCEADTAT